MPLIAWALGAYLAGLYAGFSHSPLLIALAVIAAAAAGLPRGVYAASGLVIGALIGLLLAQSATRADVRCTGNVERLHSANVILVGDASPGAFVRARVIGCGAELSIAVDSGEAPDGARVNVRGTMLRTNHGLVLQHATIAVAGGPSVLRRMRAACGRAIDRTFGEDAPLVRALLIADRHELSPEMRDRYAAAGLAHIL